VKDIGHAKSAGEASRWRCGTVIDTFPALAGSMLRNTPDAIRGTISTPSPAQFIDRALAISLAGNRSRNPRCGRKLGVDGDIGPSPTCLEMRSLRAKTPGGSADYVTRLPANEIASGDR